MATLLGYGILIYNRQRDRQNKSFPTDIFVYLKLCLYFQFYLWPKPETPGDIFVTKEGETDENHDLQRLVGFTVSPVTRYNVHFQKFSSKTTRIRFTGMDGYANQF